MMQMSTPEYPTYAYAREKKHVDYQSKTEDVRPNHEYKTNLSVLMNNEQIFRVKHTDTLILQHPTVESPKFNTLHVGCRPGVRDPKYAHTQQSLQIDTTRN